MKVVVVGAGEVGNYLCETLSERGYDVTIIERSSEKATEVDNAFDVRVLTGNGASAEMLNKANVSDCDYFLAMTSDDSVNLVACSLAKALGARSILARIHDQTYSDHTRINYQHHFGIDYLLNPEALCAVQIAKSIRNPGRVAVENFARGQIEVQQIVVSEKSRFAGKTLMDIRLDARVQVGYLQRGDLLEVPTGTTQIMAGDRITLVGNPDPMLEVKPLFDPNSAVDHAKVTLFGASETALVLIRLLQNPRFQIRIIEEDETICQQIAERYPRVTVIHGSATSLRLMEEEQVGESDYFVACTKRDEDNIMTCLQASKLGVKHVQLVINKPDYESVLDTMSLTLGVQQAVAPRVVTVDEIRRITSEEPYIDLAALPGNTARIIEVRVSHHSPCVGQEIKDIKWPPGVRIAALLQKFEARIAMATDRIMAGDRVVAIVKSDQIEKLVKALT